MIEETAGIRRPWNDAVWPHAITGFFKLEAQDPRILLALDLTG